VQQTPAHLLVARLIRRCTCLQRHAWDRPVRMWPGCNCFFLFPPVDVYFLEISFCLMFVGSNAMQIYAISHIYITYNYIIYIYIYVYMILHWEWSMHTSIHTYVTYVRTYIILLVIIIIYELGIRFLSGQYLMECQGVWALARCVSTCPGDV